MASQDQTTGAAPSPAAKNLLPHEKLAIINTLKQRDMVEGETWFVISHGWFRKWERACSGKADKDDTLIDESSLASIDNSDIADSDGNITVSPAEGINVDYVPTEAWEHFVLW
jgi:ubiquitin carboxyl-terminal hydrolase 4/11/15